VTPSETIRERVLLAGDGFRHEEKCGSDVETSECRPSMCWTGTALGRVLARTRIEECEGAQPLVDAI